MESEFHLKAVTCAHLKPVPMQCIECATCQYTGDGPTKDSPSPAACRGLLPGAAGAEAVRGEAAKDVHGWVRLHLQQEDGGVEREAVSVWVLWPAPAPPRLEGAERLWRRLRSPNVQGGGGGEEVWLWREVGHLLERLSARGVGMLGGGG